MSCKEEFLLRGSPGLTFSGHARTGENVAFIGVFAPIPPLRDFLQDFPIFPCARRRYCVCLRLPVDAFELHIPPETQLAGILLTVEQAIETSVNPTERSRGVMRGKCGASALVTTGVSSG